MELQKLIDQYLKFIKESSYSERTILRYEYLLGIFYDYMIYKNKINSSTLISYLNGITPEDILSSTNYYISKGTVSEDTISMYISVIREFFRYIKNELNIGNDNLLKSFGLSKKDKNSFSYKFKSFTQEQLHKGIIKSSKQGVPFTDEQVKLIVQYCNENLNTSKVGKNVSEENCYNRYVKSLAIKLIAYLGVSIDVLNAIEVQHLNLQYGTIIMSNYQFHLPYWLRQQLELFYKEILQNRTLSSPLLALYDRKVFPQPSVLGGFINNRLKYETDIQNPYSIISLSKYAIIQLIDSGLDRDMIIEITGYKDDIYDSCKQLVDKVDINVKSKQIDAVLKQLPSYDFL
jgi:integrase